MCERAVYYEKMSDDHATARRPRPPRGPDAVRTCQAQDSLQGLPGAGFHSSGGGRAGPSRSVIGGRLCNAPPLRLRFSPGELALFLDIDGTLAPITARPEMTRVPLDTRRTLRALQRSGVALAALSGRSLSQVRRLLLPLEIPAGGSHGAQLKLATGRSVRVTGRLPDGLIDLLQRGTERLPGVWLERKPAALALHWRQAIQCREEVAQLACEALAAAPGWRLVVGHCVHELRPAGRDKGVALRRLMRQPAFAGRWPLAIGDDRTDEDAFAAALELGGGAIRVGASVDTVAPWELSDVEALAAWLRTQLLHYTRREAGHG